MYRYIQSGYRLRYIFKRGQLWMAFYRSGINFEDGRNAHVHKFFEPIREIPIGFMELSPLMDIRCMGTVDGYEVK